MSTTGLIVSILGTEFLESWPNLVLIILLTMFEIIFQKHDNHSTVLFYINFRSLVGFRFAILLKNGLNRI